MRRSAASRPRAILSIPPETAPTPERTAKGELADVRTYEFEPDEQGRPVRRTVCTVRDLNANVAARLRRLPLTGGQRLAATLFERDHDLAKLEPRMTTDLGRIGRGAPGGADRMRLAVMEARDRRQAALGALRMAGAEAVRLVEAVVLDGTSVTNASAGQDRYNHKAAAIAWAGTTLSIGLNLLEAHYRSAGRI